MPMTATTDRAALYRGILERPDDDVARLVYADWLEENDGSEPCGRCKGTGWRPNAPASGLLSSRPYPDFPSFATIGCPHCGGKRDHKGSGTVRNGYADRAEFIRVQLRLATVGHQRRGNEGCYCDDLLVGEPCCSVCQGWEDAVREERRLFNANLCKWEFGKVVPNAAYRVPMEADELARDELPPDAIRMVYNRGFVSTVRTTLQFWVGGPCGCAAGRETNLRQAFISLACPCSGTGRTPAHGPRIVAEQPVQEVRTERIAFDNRPDYTWFCQADDPLDQRVEPEFLPREIFELLPGNPVPYQREFAHKDYHSEAAAQSAISHALVNWARREAGLPPLREHATH